MLVIPSLSVINRSVQMCIFIIQINTERQNVLVATLSLHHQPKGWGQASNNSYNSSSFHPSNKMLFLCITDTHQYSCKASYCSPRFPLGKQKILFLLGLKMLDHFISNFFKTNQLLSETWIHDRKFEGRRYPDNPYLYVQLNNSE